MFIDFDKSGKTFVFKFDVSETSYKTNKMGKDQGPPLVFHFLSGGFGGICTVLVGHPLDTIKVRLQTMPDPKPGEKPLYEGTMDCFRKIVAAEGPKGLYKGMGAPLATIVPIFSISFMGYGGGKTLFQPPPEKRENFTACSTQYLCAGCIAGFLSTIVMAPGERIKVLLQTQKGGEKKYDGPMDCAVKLFKEGGIKSIYRGTLATLMRDVPASGLYYLTYDTFKDVMTDHGRIDMGMGGSLFGGGIAGIAHWIVGMPADVIKSRFQSAPEGTYPGGQKDVIADLMKKEGPMAFYKGIAPVLLRAFPANAACFTGYEVARKFLTYVFST